MELKVFAVVLLAFTLSLAPDGSTQSSSTSAPGGTTQSSSTSAPSGTTQSSSTSAPSGTTQSSSTSAPSGTTQSSSTSAPSGTTQSSSTSAPSGTTQSSSTSAPSGTTQSSSTSAPSGTTQSSSTSAPSGTSQSSSTSAPSGTTQSSSTSASSGTPQSSSTSASSGTVELSSSFSPSGTTHSSFSSAPTGTLELSSTFFPSGTIEPSSTFSPGGTIESSSMFSPEGTIEPSSTSLPGATIVPSSTFLPEGTTKQSTSSAPERSRKPFQVKPNLETAQFMFNLSAKVHANFTDSLNNPKSELYQNYTREFKEKMTSVYDKIRGFLYIEVIGFSNGSIVVDYNISLKAEVVVEDVTDVFASTTTQPRIFNHEMDLITDTKMILHVIRDKCNAEGICPKGSTCKDGTKSYPSCEDVCAHHHCHHGTCNVKSDGKPICKCHVSDDVVYGGDQCDIQGTKMSMGKGAIAGIAGGVGGGAILLLSIALGCMCCSRRKGRNPENDMKHEDDVPLSERLERDIYNQRQPGQFNYGADIKDEYRYTGRRDDGRGYEGWLMSTDRSEREPSGRRSENDFRAPSYSSNWGRNYGDDKRRDNTDMESASMFGRESGLGTPQYSFPDEVPPDYDQDDKRQMIPHPRDQSRENPYTRMPTNRPPSRQSSLLGNNYKQGSSVYPHIDTGEQYAIKRPSFR
ncbi:mucin-1-like [Haliotis asinina]|uniref:mucin-1-like n=1 Tax=Haliotis asinina TaxID=109174 RepID=UPI00353253A8